MLKNLIAVSRPYQWIKNILIFVPLISAQKFQLESLLLCIEAVIIFSLISSSGYIINDIFDKKNDLLHPIKKSRPIASGKLSYKIAILFSITLIIIAFFLSLNNNNTFNYIIISYLFITIFYSFILKKIIFVDIIIISILFLHRINAGSASINVETSIYLLLFSIFFFISLASIKRIAEIKTYTEGQSIIPGRAYKTNNIKLLVYITNLSFYLSLLILVYYIFNANIINMYNNNILLFAVCPILFFWFFRIFKKAKNSEIDGDPILFAIKDKISVIFLLMSAIIIFFSI